MEVTSLQARPCPASRGPSKISFADLRRSRARPWPASRGPSVISLVDSWRSLLRGPGQGQPPEDLSGVVSYPTEINNIRYPLLLR
jgi:hypothetical protein